MEYYKLINFLDNKSNQPLKFMTKNWANINNDARGTYNTNTQIKFNTSMLKSSLYGYSDACILVSGTITVTRAEDNNASKQADEKNNGVNIQNCVPFTDCMSEINNTQIDNAVKI